MAEEHNLLMIGVAIIDAEHQHFQNFVKLMESADETKCRNFLSSNFLWSMLSLLRKHCEHEDELTGAARMRTASDR